MNRFNYVAVLFIVVLFAAGCKKNKNTNSGSHASGYNFGTENIATIPKAINTRNFGSSNAPLPSSHFLYNYLPPVGDQGQYGTCIGWSTAYYTKTALEAITNNYSSSQLSQTSYQMSAKDLFTAIADNQKNANCDGTNYDAALTLIQTRGVATLATVPYTNLGSCAQSGTDPNGTADAAGHKISTYRALQDGSVADYITDVKQNIASNLPVMVGVGEGSGFQNWTGSGVMTAGFDPCGGNPCGGHAQTIVGYDDSKGQGGAFRVINSWNTTWGDNGFYWVDYNFMFNTLAQRDNSGNYALFVASNSTDTSTHPTPNQTPTTGVDLAAWVEGDYNTATGNTPTRQTIFNIYNIGTATAPAATGWDLYYVYYNAYNAQDYGVIFHDAFNTSIAQNTYSCSGNQCTLNLDIPANSDLAYYGFNTSTLYQNYTMPTITGDYYLILVADAGQTLGDVDYSNNMFYTSEYPGYFTNGFGKNGGNTATFTNTVTPTKAILKKSSFNTAVDKEHRNAYTPKEIIGFLKAKKASGELDAKARAVVVPANGGISGHR